LERDVVEHVPVTVPLTVTVTEAKEIDRTLDLTGELLEHGYQVAPHLPARQFIDDRHVADGVVRLSGSGVNAVFVVAGDAPRPAGKFADAFSRLRDMETAGHPFQEVGIGGYPEGYGSIPRAAIEHARRLKAPMATRMLTQICLDARTTSRWPSAWRRPGLTCPLSSGCPGR
jgi:methylenetetrahydrofolate reductase (NADPH)